MKLITFCITALFSLSVVAAPTLVHNVKGYTLTGQAGKHARLKTFGALVFDQGKVLFIGSLKDAESKFANASRINGQGKTLLPGLIDAHGHVLELGTGLSIVDLRGASSEQDAAKRVAEYARHNPKATWILGRGWNQVLWPNNDFPTKASLDALKLNKPIVLSRVDGHAVWVNSKALAIGQITSTTSNPDGGQIVKDELGNPTGVLIDNAQSLVTRKIPPATDIENNIALDKAFSHLLSLGITSVHDAGIGEDLYRLYQRRASGGRMPVRVYAMLDGSSPNLPRWLKAGPINDDQDRLSIRSVKLYADGALGSRGAAMLEPYSDQKDHKGLLVTQPEVLNDKVEQIVSAGFQVAIHAIGDLGNRVAINAIENAFQKQLGKTLRHRIEHAQVLERGDLKRFKALNLIASMQPTHATSDMNMAEDRIGPERLKGAYAWRTLLDQGTIIAAGSDFPVELANPFHGIHAAVTRQNHHNDPPRGWIPEQKMTLTEALRSFTLDAAYAAHQEDKLGTLEPGKWADFILVDRDIFRLDPKELWKVQVLQTWVAGKKVFERATEH